MLYTTEDGVVNLRQGTTASHMKVATAVEGCCLCMSIAGRQCKSEPASSVMCRRGWQEIYQSPGVRSV